MSLMCFHENAGIIMLCNLFHKAPLLVIITPVPTTGVMTSSPSGWTGSGFRTETSS